QLKAPMDPQALELRRAARRALYQSDAAAVGGAITWDSREPDFLLPTKIQRGDGSTVQLDYEPGLGFTRLIEAPPAGALPGQTVTWRCLMPDPAGGTVVWSFEIQRGEQARSGLLLARIHAGADGEVSISGADWRREQAIDGKSTGEPLSELLWRIT